MSAGRYTAVYVNRVPEWVPERVPARGLEPGRCGLRRGLSMLLLALAGGVPPALAEPPPAAAAGVVQPVDLLQASEKARAMLGGEIIKAELTRERGRDVFTVRLLDQGRVREVRVDAATGDMMLPGQNEVTE